MRLDVYREVTPWKKPLHATRTQLAKSYLKLLPNIEVIGITGSVGKTLTQNAIASVLSQKYRIVVGNENLDPIFRIPQTIFKAKPWDQKLILEYGVEQPGDMDHYISVIKPKIAVVTIIAPTHTKYFGGVEGVFTEKSKLVKALSKDGYAVLNADDPLTRKMAKVTNARIFWYGKRAKNGVKISHFSQNSKGSKFRLHYLGQKATVSSKFVGKHQLIAAYAASTVGIIEGLTLKQIAKGLSLAKVPGHRLTPIISKNFSILDDTYNSSPEAARQAIATLLDLGKNKQKIAVLGEMKDLGDLSEEAHKSLGEKIAKTSIDYLITIGPAKIISDSAKRIGFKGKILNVNSTDEAIKQTQKLKGKNAIVLIKGSRHAHLERVVYGLLGKSTAVTCYHCGDLR